MIKDGRMIEPIYLRAFGAVILLLLAAIVALSLAGRKKSVAQSSDAGKSKMPMMALELPKNVNDIRDNVGDLGNARRAAMLRDLTPDSLLFIPSYTFFFLAMSWLLTQRRFSWALWLGIIAGACGIGAAVLDYMENANIRALLETGLAETTQQMIDSARHVSLCKWALSFITTGLLSTLFLWRRDAIVLLGFLYALTALVGLVGLIYRPAIGWAFGLMGLATLSVIIVFCVFAGRFLQEL
ncbi:MAG TPA: hypothetical protein VGC89_07805 [Pyrinomonadaceae bacterium]